MAQGRIPRLDTVALDAPALMFGLLISCLVALLFAVPACWQVSYSDLNQTLASADARVSSTRGSLISSLLMTFEVALSLAVLLAATMLVRSVALTLDTDPGFRPEGVLAVNVPLAQEWDKSYDMFLNRILPGLQSIPGVQEVAAVKTGGKVVAPGTSLGGALKPGPSGIRLGGGVNPDQALLRNAGTCRSNVKGEAQVGDPCKGKSTDVEHRDGAVRSRDEGFVIGLDRRDCGNPPRTGGQPATGGAT